jgi:predicted nucleic acid-binding protein
MIRVVLDANVYVSSVLKPSSNLGQIIDLVRRLTPLRTILRITSTSPVPWKGRPILSCPEIGI